MSSTYDQTGAGRLNEDRRTLNETVGREADAAKAEASKASDNLRDGASKLVDDARSKVREGAEVGKARAASSLDDFTAAIRKASDELGERDQSMAAGLVRQAAEGLEQASGALKGRDLREMTHSVADFARRQPAAFLIGAALAGVAIGRFARASSDHSDGARLREAMPGSSHGSSSERDSRSYGSREFTSREREEVRTGMPASSSGSTYTSSTSPSATPPRSADPLGAGAPDAGLLSGGARAGAGTSSTTTTPSTPTTPSVGTPGVSGSTNTEGLTGRPYSEGDKR